MNFNGLDGNLINDWISSGVILNINNNNTYYRNYITGAWSINKDILFLQPDSNLIDFFWEYKIVELTENSLEMRVNLSEGQYCCDFAEFTSDELLTINEKYIRSE